MTTRIKNPINDFAPVFLMLVAMFLFGFGCNPSKPVPDPLADFHFCSLNNLNSNKAISDDYKDYIQKLKLSPEEGKYVAYTEFFEDGTGQHAVKITISLNKTDWEHVLIYDKDNKRIKTIKYVIGHSAS